MAKYKIVIDLLGSDKGPSAILEGAKLILKESPNVNLILVGPKEEVEKAGIDVSRIEVVDTAETVTNYDNPVEAFYKNPNVSVFKAVELASHDDVSGIISAGNTGALFVATLRYL